MKRITVVAFAVLCVCMAATASASAHLFHASKTGKLLGSATSEQVFLTEPGGNNVTCTKAATTGTVTELLALQQAVEVVYSGCTAFSFVNVDISPAKYLLSADGLAAITNTITILVLKTFLNEDCTITVHPQNLGTVKYNTDKPNASAILQLSEITGILSLSSGGKCGTAGDHSGGTYTGSNLIILDGGAIGWL
jgi:hypothetical protein